MLIRKALARTVLRATRWRLVGAVPSQGILVGAPHTSNWDFIAMLLIAWSSGVQPQVLVKKSFFKGPMGPLLRALGGIPLDRANPGDTIRALLAEAGEDDAFLLCIAAEGTRSRGEFWKAGFLRIAERDRTPGLARFRRRPDPHDGHGPDVHAVGRPGGRHGRRPCLLRRQARLQAGEPHRAAPA